MKRLVLALLCVMAFVGTMWTVSASEEGKLLLWCDDTRSAIMKDLAGKFTSKYNVPVEVQEINFGDIRDQLAVAGPAGKGPDILIGPHDWLGQLVVSGLVAPVDLGKKRKDFEILRQKLTKSNILLPQGPFAIDDLSSYLFLHLRSLLPGPYGFPVPFPVGEIYIN